MNDNKTIKYLKIIKNHDPSTWWAEYPPKLTYGKKKLNEKEIMDSWQSMFNRSKLPISVYVNIPFCSDRCGFCKYYSETKTNIPITKYLNSLYGELELYKINYKKNKLDALYFGGGTPSLLGEKDLAGLFEIFRKKFIYKNNIQINFEGTPETLDGNKIKLLKKNGVNRLTIGAQVFDDCFLKKLNRKHNCFDIEKTFNTAKEEGIEAINLDMIMGLPGQNKQTYIKSFSAILRLEPECLSFHEFVSNKRSTIKTFCDFNYKELFDEFKSKLRESGYKEMEGFSGQIFAKNDNFANKGLINRYKQFPVFGIGSCAGSWVSPFKYYNQSRVIEYVKKINSGELPGFYGIKLNLSENIRRYLIHRFVLFGYIPANDFKLLFNTDARAYLEKNYPNLGKSRLIKYKNANVEFDRTHVSKNFSGIDGLGLQEKMTLFCINNFYSKRVLHKLSEYL